jgi:rhamnogalacturonyl hydrolase YesR
MKDLSEVTSRVARRTLSWPLGHWYWGDAICVDGLLAAGETLPAARERAAQLLRFWVERTPRGYHDALGPGAAIALLVQQGELPPAVADRFLEAVEGLPQLYPGVPALEPHLPRFRFGLCIDALYHLPPALAAIGRLRSDERLMDRGAQMALLMLERLRFSGGFAHWYDVAEDRNNGVAWSRGAGWALLGLLDTAALCEERAARDDLLLAAAEVSTAIAEGAGPGGWGPVLGRPDLPRESSVAAFYLAATRHPASPVPDRNDLHRPAVDRLLGDIDGQGVFRGVSADVLPSWDPTSYETFVTEPSPWGQGVALRALAALSGGHFVPGLPPGSATAGQAGRSPRR